MMIKSRVAICLIDESGIEKSTLATMLNSIGIHVSLFCTNLQQAIEEYDCYSIKGAPDFILSEWTREFSDPAFLAVYNNSPLANIPIILVSNEELDISPDSLQVLDVIQLPVKRKQLVKVIQRNCKD